MTTNREEQAMEASDAFAQEIDGDQDPFSGSDFDSEFGDPQAETGLGAEPSGLPTVNREGERLDGPFTDTPPESLEAVAVAPAPVEAPVLTEHAEAALEATGDPTLPAESAGPTEGATESADPPFAEAGTTPSASEPSPTTQPSGERVATDIKDERTDTPLPGEAEPDPTSAATPADVPAVATGPSAGESSSTPEQSAAAEEEEAAPPEEATDKSGRVTKRRYLIFQVDGPGKLTQVSWYEDNKGNLVKRGEGGKRQSVCLARSSDDALKFGFAAVGAPIDGATLAAVAAQNFQPKKIKPLPPEPLKQRLSIS